MGKFAAKGTLLKVGDGASPEVFTTIAHVTNIPGPETSRDMMDATALDSAGGYRESIPGLRDGGEIQIEGFFDATDTGQQALRTNLEDEEEARNFQVVLPVAIAKQWNFTAYCNKYAPGHAVNGIAAFSATLKITGKPTLTSTT